MGDNYEPKDPSTFITYLDANNLYGWAISKPLPTGGFRWMSDKVKVTSNCNALLFGVTSPALTVIISNNTKLTGNTCTSVVVFQRVKKMAASSLLESRVDEMTTCRICFEEFTSPRTLPCLHSFCLGCLQGACRDKVPRDKAQCPLCRRQFSIPKDGLEGLELNFDLQNLIDTKRASRAKSRAEPCEVCSTDQQFICATVHCVDCSQRLCERCSLSHKRWKGGAHDVRPLGAELRSELEQTLGRKALTAVQKVAKKFKISGKIMYVFLIPLTS